jgi:hypothetical protein
VSGGAFGVNFTTWRSSIAASEGLPACFRPLPGDLTRRKGLSAGREGGRGEGEVIQGRGTSSLQHLVSQAHPVSRRPSCYN